MNLEDPQKTTFINFPFKNNGHKLSEERILELFKFKNFAETDFCDAVSSIDKNSSLEILEFLLNQSIKLGNPYYALEICGFLNRKLTKDEAGLIIRNALKRGRTSTAIDAAILNISEEVFNDLICHLSDPWYIPFIDALEKLIESRKDPMNNSGKLTIAEEETYLAVINKVRELMTQLPKKVIPGKNKKLTSSIIKKAIERIKKTFLKH